ncbi:MAG: LarC family nickel insertion protein, partial [Bacillota bacterium]
MKILYLDCFGGVSGDMVLGAFIDAGVPLTPVAEQLKLLGLEGYTLRTCRDKTHSFSGTRFLVEITQDHRQSSRTWKDISRIITGSDLTPQIKEYSLAIFEKLALAEAKVHGVPPEKVHFHEVGAVDSIIDIVGTAIALHEAGIKKVCCSPLPTGYGCIWTAHGLLPVPAPATAELLKGIPIRPVRVEGELVTPTGAAIVAVLAEDFGPAPAMRIEQTG